MYPINRNVETIEGDRSYASLGALPEKVDGVVIVVTEGKTRRQVALAAVQPLRDRKANLIGVVLNDRTFSIPKFLYERI